MDAAPGARLVTERKAAHSASAVNGPRAPFRLFIAISLFLAETRYSRVAVNFCGSPPEATSF
jgi:hypothetical protein